ncbi:hypothetical protein AC578_8460 [Pseudocercospora eumusae]|uniref:Uncharacterized protein n=1 Tax=Pseudocercospora eumusae TaxID=321146 RepID=A0A139GXD7_9PEZI|nr:hypothetical protein AC578_8460 [Pseudocercospora eumusae]
MAPRCRALYFPAASNDAVSRFRRLRHVSQGNPAVEALLHTASRTWQDEVGNIPSSMLPADLPYNAKAGGGGGGGGGSGSLLLQLAEHQDRYPWAPAQVVLTLVAQLADLVFFYNNNNTTTTTTTTPYGSPSCHDHVLAGVGAGLLGAALAAVARDSWDVVRLSRYVVAVGLRCAVDLEHRARDIDLSEFSWQVKITGPPALDDLASKLDLINHHVPGHHHAYIGIISRSTASATLVGPPSTLAKVNNVPDFPWHRSSMPSRQPNTMFAPHLKAPDVGNMLQGLASDALKWPILRLLLSPHDGKPFEAKTFGDLLALALHDIVDRCVDLDALATSLAHWVSQRSEKSLELLVLGSHPDHCIDFAQIMSRISVDFSFLSVQDIHAAGKTPATGCLPRTKAVAIVGMAGRFPGSDGVEELWSVLEKGSSTAAEIPSSRFSMNALQDANTGEVSCSPSGHFIKSPGDFDHRLFAISPVEAMQMDPIQRMALIATYEALEMAGYSGSDDASGPDPARIAVYFGQTTDDWKFINQQRGIDTHYLPGVNRSFTPGRISRYFGWSGGFYSIDTGCSSSATCLCLARDALIAGEIDMAVVGGGNLLAAPEWYLGLGKGEFLSKAGFCSTFAESADGYCRGEAVAVVILKRQEDALNGKDNILATIASAARNSNARTSASMTAPSQSAQSALYRRVLWEAALSPSDIDYIEMHGTGTQLGDHCEMAAVANVFAQGHTGERPLIVGAVKANIGHTEAAAGIVSLIKTILVLQHNKVPPQPGWPFPLNSKFAALLGQEIVIANGQPLARDHRNFLVNSFDAAGGNVSIVVQDPPTRQPRQEPTKGGLSHHIVVISGHSEASFMDFKTRLHLQLIAQPDLELCDLAYSTTARRSQKMYRKSLVVRSAAQLIGDLAKPCSPLIAGKDFTSNIVFTFTGQGSQYTGMGRTIYQTSPSFRRLLDSYEIICQGYGFGFLEVITQANSLAEVAASKIQVATTALEIAMASYLVSLGLVPTLVIGHSIGEYAALCIAGALSVADVLWLVHHRARLVEQNCEPRTHGMLSVNLPALAIQKHWGEICEISCHNSPSSTVVSAPLAHIQDLGAKLTSEGVRCTRLDVDFAFHSSQIDPICASFEASVEQVPFRRTEIPLASTVLGRIVDPGESAFNARYLTRHARQPVDFVSAVQACEENGFIQDHTIVVEIGPHPTNIGLIQSSLRATRPKALATLRRGQDDWYGISSCLAVANDAGIRIKWHEFHEPFLTHLQHVPLPLPFFDCRNFWEPFDQARSGLNHTVAAPEEKLLSSSLHRLHSLSKQGSQAVGVFYSTVSERDLATAIKGHVVDGISICPTSVFIDMALSAATYLVYGSLTTHQSVGSTELTDLDITRPLILEPHDKSAQVRIEARFDREKSFVLVHIMATNGGRTGSVPKYATCQISVSTGERQNWSREWNKIRRLVTDRCSSINAMCPSEDCKLNRTLFYHMFAELVTYSDAYRTIQEATIPDGFRDASATFKFEGNTVGTFLLNPYMIDSVVHIAGFLLNADPKKGRDMMYISNRIGSFRMFAEISPQRRYQVYASVRDESIDKIARCDVYVFDDSLELLLSCEGIQFQRIERSSFQRLAKQIPSSADSPLKETQRANDGESASLNSRYLSSSSPTCSVTPSLDEEFELFNVLKSIISAASGLSVPEIESTSTFGDMGIDSQMRISITAQFKIHTGIELPTSVFASTSTFSTAQRELTLLLEAQRTPLSRIHGSPGPKEKSTELSRPLTNGHSNNVGHFATLLRTVSDTLGVEMNELDSSTTWQSLGLNSMHSIRILSTFKEETGVELPASYFLLNETVADVRTQMGSEPEGNQPSRISSQEHLFDGERGARCSRAVLLQGSAQSHDPPLFLLTDGSGTVEAYTHLPALPNGRRTYGLESPYISDPLNFTVTISQLAKMFISTIRSIQPHGPYLIGGWSVGGKYAFEVSRQLSLAHQKIALLLILDTRPPRPRPLNIAVNFGTLDDIGMTTARGKNLSEDFTERERDHLYASCRVQSREQTRAFTPHQEPPRLCAIVWATRGLNEHADPARHRAEVRRKAAMGPVEEEEEEVARGGVEALRMIYKSWLFGERRDFGTNGWENWVGGKGKKARMVVETLDADHFSMVTPPDVYRLGGIIVRLVMEASNKVSGL